MYENSQSKDFVWGRSCSSFRKTSRIASRNKTSRGRLQPRLGLQIEEIENVGRGIPAKKAREAKSFQEFSRNLTRKESKEIINVGLALRTFFERAKIKVPIRPEEIKPSVLLWGECHLFLVG